MKQLKEIKTFELVNELKCREGVEKIAAEPHVKKTVEVEGPATILIVTD